jgi:hypothetical protein
MSDVGPAGVSADVLGRELVGLPAPPSGIGAGGLPVSWCIGMVQSVEAGPPKTLTATLGGSSEPCSGIAYAANYEPVAGDKALVFVLGDGDHFALCAQAGSAGGGAGISWPLTFSGDMEFEPDGFTDKVLTLASNNIGGDPDIGLLIYAKGAGWGPLLSVTSDGSDTTTVAAGTGLELRLAGNGSGFPPTFHITGAAGPTPGNVLVMAEGYFNAYPSHATIYPQYAMEAGISPSSWGVSGMGMDTSGNIIIVSFLGGGIQLRPDGMTTAELTVEAGHVVARSGVGVFGQSPPSAQPTTPVTLGDVVTLLQSYGLCA